MGTDNPCTIVSPSGQHRCERHAGHEGDHACIDPMHPGFSITWKATDDR